MGVAEVTKVGADGPPDRNSQSLDMMRQQKMSLGGKLCFKSFYCYLKSPT